MKEELQSTIDTVVETVSKVDKGTVDKIMSKLEVMASGLGTTAEYLWGIMIKQAYVMAMIDVGYIILATTGMAIFGFTINKTIRAGWCTEREQYQSEYGLTDPRTIAMMPICIIGGLFTIVFSIAIFSAILPELAVCLINPEYWAFEQICNKIR